KGTGEDLSKMFDIAMIHNCECAFYDAARNVTDFPLPKVWYTGRCSDRENGVILMEDLSLAGCKTGFFGGMTAQQIRNIVRHYAALHAHQLCMGDEEKAKWELIASTTQANLMYDAGEKMMSQLIPLVKETQQAEIKDLLDKLKPAMGKKFGVYALNERPVELGIPLVFVHGDSGGHNMFFKKAADGTPSNEVCAFLDFQISFKTNPFADISRIVMNFVDAEVRRELDATLIAEYYGHLQSAVAKSGGKLTFGPEQLHEVYALSKIFSSYMPLAMLGLLPVVLNGKHSPAVVEAIRAKQVLRARLALEDGIALATKYAPEYIAE
ncbi:calcium/calmodulin-dependent protein kinase type 1, partial [Aphelenchoides avenae]